ncbi:DNA-binding transcriptional regulator [Falsiroseomonas sp. HC035]|uniref:DNA-binding transcriptional regulator n=1 Tax=Falsiroseomonas sp. HC035 TaxID=3390999 RepID=UPI003D31B044
MRHAPAGGCRGRTGGAGCQCADRQAGADRLGPGGDGPLTEAPVQSVLRALSILRELNRQQNTTVDQLHRATGLPKPTVLRLLGTLAGAGLVMKGERGIGYRVTSDVQALSAGLQGGPLVVEAGRPWAAELTRRLRWPAAIAVRDGGRIAIRLSTAASSPVSPFHATIGMRHSLVTRALGRAYLGCCPEAERHDLLRLLAASTDPEDHPPGLERVVRMIVAMVRRQGYALRDPNVEPRSSNTVAVPIRLGDAVAGTIGLSFFRSAISRQALVEELVPALQQASREISAAMLRLHSGMRNSGSSSFCPGTPPH